MTHIYLHKLQVTNMAMEQSHKEKREAIERSLELKLKKVKEDEIREKRLREAVRDLPHVPGSCPVSRCHEVVFPCNLMTHMLHKHMYKPNCMTSEIYDHKPVVVCFDPTTFQHGENHCVATLVYGGVKNKPKSQPGVSLLSRPNAALISKNRKFVNYLPIMMMVCRTTWYAQLRDKELERQLVEMNGDKAVIYVVWLVTPSITRKLHYTLTVYDRHYLNARSVVRTVRNYTANQNPSVFLPYEDNYLLMRETEVREFIKAGHKNESAGIPMEIIVYEKSTDEPVRHSSAKELQEAQQKLEEVYLEGGSSRLSGGAKGKGSMQKKPRTVKETITKLPKLDVRRSPFELSSEEQALEQHEDEALKKLEGKQRVTEILKKREKVITRTSKSLPNSSTDLTTEEEALELLEDKALKRLEAKKSNSIIAGSDMASVEYAVRLGEEESLTNSSSLSSILT